MVSPLSSRLLASGYSSSSSSDTMKRSNSRNGDGSTGGYSADRDSNTSFGLPPVLIDLQRHKRKSEAGEEDPAKKCKTDEMNYVASTVRDAFEKAAKTYPEMNTKISTVVPDLDLSKVKLLSSKSVESSPFLHTSNCGWTAGRYDILTDFGAAYAKLLGQTSMSYQPHCVTPRPQDKSSSDVDETGSTSSVSDTDSDASRAFSTMIVLNARLDDSTNGQQPCNENDLLPPQKQKVLFLSCPPATSISMEEAVGVCDFSRLITCASYPYKTVFVNAAYERLTGVSSVETLGRHLSDLVIPMQEDSLSLEACVAASSDGTDTKARVFSRTEEFSHCVMKVTPIVSSWKDTPVGPGCDAIGDAREVNNVTHYAIDLMDVRDDGAVEQVIVLERPRPFQVAIG